MQKVADNGLIFEMQRFKLENYDWKKEIEINKLILHDIEKSLRGRILKWNFPGENLEQSARLYK